MIALQELTCPDPASGEDRLGLSDRALEELLDAGPTVSVDGDVMTWSAGERTAAFVESPDGSVPTTTTNPPVTTTVAPATTVPATTTTVLLDPDGLDVSDEVLGDPLMFGADGFLRELVGRTIVVRSNPEVVIPIDVPDDQLRFLGVGPDNVAYVSTTTGPEAATGWGPNRLLAIPTTGPNAGVVFELFPLQEIDGAWGFTMEAGGIDHLDLSDDIVPIPFVDANGAQFDGSDPSFTWFLDYDLDTTLGEPGNPMSANVVITFTNVSTRDSYRAPIADTGREGQIPGLVRPLPDGRLPVVVLVPDDSDFGVTPVVLALDPSTGLWTQHPVG